MCVWCRCCRFTAGPECHLASVDAVEDIPFDTGSRLLGGGDPVCRAFHEVGESVHTFSNQRSPLAAAERRVCVRQFTETAAATPEYEIMSGFCALSFDFQPNLKGDHLVLRPLKLEDYSAPAQSLRDSQKTHLIIMICGSAYFWFHHCVHMPEAS